MTYVERMVSVSMYNRGAGSRSVIVCGGWNLSNTDTVSCKELPIDANGLPAASSWRSFASLPSPLTDGCMLHVNGKVHLVRYHSSSDIMCLQLYHIGGIVNPNDASAVSSVYVYDEASEQWHSAPPLPQALFLHRCTVLNCQGLVCGGFTANGVLSFRSFQHNELSVGLVEAVLLV